MNKLRGSECVPHDPVYVGLFQVVPTGSTNPVNNGFSVCRSVLNSGQTRYLADVCGPKVRYGRPTKQDVGPQVRAGAGVGICALPVFSATSISGYLKAAWPDLFGVRF